ncbi:protein FAM136A [Dendrobium catenatum]|nr:protein FAM136A [Dendrobium catenatum]
MDHIAAMEERMVTDKIRRKLEEVNLAAQNQLQPIQDHVNFTLQQSYFKCAYECFDRRRRQEEINSCVESCSVPVLKANNLVETEMAQFQERMNRSLMVCQDKFEAAKLQQMKTGAMGELEACVNQAIDDNIRVLPHIVNRLKNSLSMN